MAAAAAAAGCWPAPGGHPPAATMRQRRARNCVGEQGPRARTGTCQSQSFQSRSADHKPHTTVTRHKTALLLAAAIKSTNYDCRTTYYDSLPYIYNTYMNISRAPGQLIHDARALFLRCGEHPWAAPGAKPSECYVPMPPPRATLPLSAQTRPCILRTGLLPGATH